MILYSTDLGPDPIVDLVVFLLLVSILGGVDLRWPCGVQGTLKDKVWISLRISPVECSTRWSWWKTHSSWFFFFCFCSSSFLFFSSPRLFSYTSITFCWFKFSLHPSSWCNFLTPKIPTPLPTPPFLCVYEMFAFLNLLKHNVLVGSHAKVAALHTSRKIKKCRSVSPCVHCCCLHR